MAVLSAFLDRRLGILFGLGFSAGLPQALIFSTLAMWLGEIQLSIKTITFFSWATLAYSFKFIWSPLVDNLPLPYLNQKFGRRRSWLIFTQMAIGSALIAMALTDPAEHLVLMAVFSCCLAFASASQDIVIDAYRIDVTRDDPALAASSVSAYIAGYRIAMVVSGGGALLLVSGLGSSVENYSRMAWLVTYLVMAGIAFSCLLVTYLAPEPKNHEVRPSVKNQILLLILFLSTVITFALAFSLIPEPKSASKLLKFILSGIHLFFCLGLGGLVGYLLIRFNIIPMELAKKTWFEPILDFFQRYEKKALLLLALIGLYRIADTVIGVVANPFYQFLKYTNEDIAMASKTFGIIVTIIGGFVGGFLIKRFNLWSILFYGAFFSASTNLLFILLAQANGSLMALYLAIGADNLFGGIANCAFVAFLSVLTNVQFTAIQYALFSSLMGLIPRLFAGYSGSIVAEYGYERFFAFTFILGLPILYLVYKNRQQLGEKL